MRQQPQGTRTDTLDYVKAMLGQLRIMADAAHCDMLAYLIEMAHLEANDLLRNERGSKVGCDKRDSATGMPFQAPGKVKFQ